MAEFAANNNDSASTRLSLFFASRGLYLQISFNIIDFWDITACEQINKKKTNDISESM